VAKDAVFVGILNRYALKAFQRRVRGIFKSTVYNRARFFSIGELKYLFTSLLGDVPVTWQTTCHFPGTTNRLVERFEKSKFAAKSPFGAYAGIMALPVPRFRTQPLKLKTSGAKAVPSNGRPVSCIEKKAGNRWKV